MTESLETLAAEKQRLEEAIRKRRSELALRRAASAELFENAEDGVALISANGYPRVNPVAEELMKMPSQPEGPVDGSWQEKWGFFRLETGEKLLPQNLPGFRVLRGGEPKQVDEFGITAPHLEQAVYLAATACRLDDGGSITILRDIGVRVRAEKELSARNERLSEQNAEHQRLIDRLRLAVRELAIPILQVAESVLVVPIIGALDGERSVEISERLLAEIVRTGASHVIIDVTGVEVMDTATAERFARLAVGVELLGARCSLSGVQPRVAQTLTALDVRLDRLSPYRNLAHALASEEAEE